MRIDANPVAGFAAEQLPDGLSQSLAENVPKCDFDGTQRGHHQGAAAIARAAEHALPMELNVGGVFAGEVSLVFKDGLLDRSFLACKGPFAESNQPLVREDLDEDKVFIAAGVD